jgi:N-acetylglucosamine-6-sulfatase
LGRVERLQAEVLSPPNVLLIVTDDQRWDTLWSMPNVQADLVARGVEFADAHVVDPLCCPARAAILTGQYAHTNGVYGNHNSDPHGGFNAFNDSVTVATVLHDAGYRTALSGKYLNGYGELDANQPATYVPPGWDDWHAETNAVESGNGYYNYQLNENGTLVDYGSDPSDYLTDVSGQFALDAMDASVQASESFFVEWTPTSPHAAAIPASSHTHDFDDLKPWRPASYNESDVSDKPLWLQNSPPLGSRQQAIIDAFRRNQYATLQTVDEWVGRMVEELGHQGVLDNTMIVFTSDNGYAWGEHRQSGKNIPYEEATRVPLVVRYDAIDSVRKVADLATNIDLSPTFADLTGTTMPNADGISILPFLEGESAVLRAEHLIEQEDVRKGHAASVPAWCMLQREGYSFTRYGDGEEEFYNLKRDPLQLTNRVNASSVQNRVSRMRRHLHALCQPLPPGMMW